jgi:hypothetical protein
MAKANVRQTPTPPQATPAKRISTINIQVVSPEAFSAAREASRLLAQLGVVWLVFHGDGVINVYEQSQRTNQDLRIIRH